MARKLKKKMKSRVIKAKVEKDLSPKPQIDSFEQEFFAIHSIPKMLEFAAKNKKVELEARIVDVGKKKILKFENKQSFFEAFKKAEKAGVKLKEDAFATDAAAGPNLVGQESIPLIGGPYAKQLYYQDYIRMHMQAFYAYHNDPAAKAVVSIIKDFSLGRGWTVEAKSEDPTKKTIAAALWDAFKQANKLDEFMTFLAIELSIYGENMVWRLPDNATKVGYQLKPGQDVPKGLFPRYRLVDPSSCWDIITYPEDITRVLAYQLVFPTQYQTYTHVDGTGQSVPTLKFIYNQIPAEQIRHYKVNVVSNEKRGRSDLYPVMNYLKRLRDTINYSVIAMQKAAAWSIDTTIDGAQEDIDAYIESQNALGSIPPAGSEFVHTKAVDRKYLNNAGAGGKSGVESFSWLLSMIAMGTRIPVSYFGTHVVATSSRASAETAVQPIFKMIEMRREVYKTVLSDMFNDLMATFGVKGVTCDVIFPEIMVEDRSSKLKDLELAETTKWVAHETAANIAAKELGVRDYDFAKEQAKIKAEPPSELPTSLPLSSPGAAGADGAGSKKNVVAMPDPASDEV
jgi:hypothetical protein